MGSAIVSPLKTNLLPSFTSFTNKKRCFLKAEVDETQKQIESMPISKSPSGSNMSFFLVTLVLGFVLSFGVTQKTLKYALKKGLLDEPNHRSSHKKATPTSGGLGLVLGVSTGMFLLLWQTFDPFLLFLVFAGLLVSLSGLWDDIKGLSVQIRFLLYLLLSIAGLFLLNHSYGLTIPFLTHQVQTPTLTFPFYLLFILWLINLYNFMDGIDGLLTTQGICVSLGYILLLLIQNSSALEQIYTQTYALIAVCLLSFLFFNWHPAKIFMGNVGSIFLGFILAFLAVLGQIAFQIPLECTLIIHGAFLTDATTTLIRRGLSGQNVLKAHRDHAYQHATQMGYSHAQVSLFFAFLNLFWLVPLALLALLYPHGAFLILVIAFTPLFYLVWKFKAGIKTS
ncbi:MAG: glycosyltransferase family 4 protein [Bdellovibrio sp.]|nr:MAG: glycosyltransferase family 4 protein [Bdellovibrio sp.]